MLVVAAGPAWGQAPSPPRYPWDIRPATCLNGPRVAAPGCTVENWPTFDETRRRVAGLYQAEQFSLLEQALAEIAASQTRFTSGRPATSAAYWAFRLLMPGPGVPVAEQDRMARWRAAVPHSSFATLAEARFLYAHAWNARGSGYAQSVSKEAWAIFAARLHEAERVLLRAPQPLQDTPWWHNLLLSVALDTRTAQTDPQATFIRGVTKWPEYYDFYDIMVKRLMPKWGGTWEKLEAFIVYWATQQAPREGTSLYARLYVNLRDQGVTPGETQVNWPHMQRSFGDLIARYPDPAFKNLYASYACFARDKAAFGDAMRGLPPALLMPQEWLAGHTHDACVRWAAN
jgi:hypothetical protein